MTPQEAIKILENEKPGCGEKARYSEGELCEAFDMAIEALKRDVPVKPIQMATPRRTKFFEFYDWKCPVCNCFLAYEEDGKHLILAHEKSRCSNCFQLIDWSSEDDT